MKKRIGLLIIAIASILAILTSIYIFLNFQIVINSNELNIFLTFALVVFASIEALSALSNNRTEKKRKRTVDLRNELEKVYGPIYSILNKIVIQEERRAVITHSERVNLDKTFSKEPFTTLSQQVWKSNRMEKHNDIDMNFIEFFKKEYENKKGEGTIEEQFSTIYSMFKNIHENIEEKGILLPSEKTMIDEKFSNYPFMISQELYDFWNKEIRSLEPTIGWRTFDYRVKLFENLRITKNEAINMQRVYLFPKAFISKFLEEYRSKVSEFRKF